MTTVSPSFAEIEAVAGSEIEAVLKEADTETLHV